MVNKSFDWIPDRRDIILVSHPSKTNEVHPFLVLSEKDFNNKTSLVSGLPLTMADYNKDNPFAIDIGKILKKGKETNGYILAHQVKSLDWRTWQAEPHPVGRLKKTIFDQACVVLNQIIDIK
ncbi:MAG: hypothetical protein Ctma_0594 [Catillopecten margaritatus gill symbiont]|uniref:Growth inhibitor PemK n=1 Tax=Catillopecten margaritatus gill symbiont TaxID=3083288 RepID=A0AAU6PFW8_9GAMM